MRGDETTLWHIIIDTLVMTDQSRKDITEAAKTLREQPAKLSRRALIKGGAVAMPAILTLHSGAALARSSNLISASSPQTTDRLGRTLCVSKRSVVPADRYREVYDLGHPPRAEVNISPGPRERVFYAKDHRIRMQTDDHLDTTDNDDDSDSDDAKHEWRHFKRVSPAKMCERGGPYWWKSDEGPWQMSHVEPGFVASAGALSSFAGYVKDDLI